MKVKENVTVYICEHCKKKLFRKHAMELHEKWCTKNPDNFVACAGCVYLKETDIEIWHDGYYEQCSVKRKAFRCDKLGKMLYPIKVQRLGLDKKYPETFSEQEPMPKECEHIQYY